MTERHYCPVCQQMCVRGQNATIIQGILDLAGRSMRLNEVSRYVYESGLITSPRGYAGVYAIVSTVVRRNPGKRFVRLEDGRLDLKSRLQPV